MRFFCGALDLDGGKTDFNELRRICAPHGASCAGVTPEFSVLYAEGEGNAQVPSQPITVRHNGHLYAAVMITASRASLREDMTRDILRRYFETGEDCVGSIEEPFALLIYDGRCGELLACRSGGGEIPLFCSKRGSRIYFSTSLFPLYRLFGGCIRVKKRILREYLRRDICVAPAELFCDIRQIPCGKGVFCTRFGESEIDVYTPEYTLTPHRSLAGVPPARNFQGDIGAVLTETLFAYGYPQFDCYMPSFIEEARRAAARGVRSLRIQDATFGAREYSAQRAYALSELCGVRMIAADSRAFAISRRSARNMERRIDALLGEYLNDSACVLHSVFEGENILDRNKKSTPLRIREKGMLCQTVSWFEHFNIVAE